MGVTLGAEFLVAAGELCSFESADKLASYAGVVPATHDSGKRRGNDKRMRGGNKVLKYFFYQSAFASLSQLERLQDFLRSQAGRGQAP